MAIHRKLVAAVLCVAVSGCATAKPQLSPMGRHVEVHLAAVSDAGAKGELMAVGPEQLWVLERDGVKELPLREIDLVRVQRHGLTGQRAKAWAGLGALTTGGALTGACASVEGNSGRGCVLLGAVVAVTWALIGWPSAASLGRSSELRVRKPSWNALRPYARFPQGVPEGLDLHTLHASPSPTPPPR